MLIKNNSKGFSLIELILVLGLSSAAFLSLVQWQTKSNENYKAKIAGEQFLEVGGALAAYIAREQDGLFNMIPSGNFVDLPLQVLQGRTYNITTGALGAATAADGSNCYPQILDGTVCGREYLPSTFNPLHAFGSNYVLQVKNNAGRLEGIVISSDPVCEKGTAVACPSANNSLRMDWAGTAVREMGAQGGLINLGSSTQLSGYNAAWGLTNTDFGAISGEGKIGYRVSTTDHVVYDDQYLRLDGTSVMRGNLNMGNWDINNATNITYNGWLSGNGVLANTISSGTINNAGNIQTTNLYATLQVKAGQENVTDIFNTSTPNVGAGSASASVVGFGRIESDNSITANNQITSFRTMSTRDIFLGNNDALIADPSTVVRGRTSSFPNVWLSDLIPKYVSHGVVAVIDGSVIPYPSCGGGTTAGSPVGQPKILLTPQTIGTEGPVIPGDPANPGNAITSSGNYSSWSLNLDLAAATAGGWLALPNAAAKTWTARYFYPPFRDISGFNAALAHVYCSYDI